MRRLLLVALFAAAWMAQGIAGNDDVLMYEKYFTGERLRVDFALYGDASTQGAALMQLRQEPVWGGPEVSLEDPFDYGHYRVRVFDVESGKLLYSKGFSTLFEEWRSTPQALVEQQAWVNSVTVPFPKDDVRVEIQSRTNHDMEFRTILSAQVDPQSIDIDRSGLAGGRVEKIAYSGDPAEKADIVFVAEGYAADQQDKFFKDAQRFADALIATHPFSGMKDDFNIWAVGTVSQDSGTDFSGEGIFANTALNSGFYTFGVDRYLTTRDMKSLRDALWNVPDDVVFILVNSDVYGGSGMYNQYACGTSDNAKTIEVFVHELGHCYAGLGDEYYTSEVAVTDFYSFDNEPWEPNITTLVDYASKWEDMQQRGECGLFEGAGYCAKGIYRPAEHCMMNDLKEFCPVCVRAIERMTDYYCGRRPGEER